MDKHTERSKQISRQTHARTQLKKAKQHERKLRVAMFVCSSRYKNNI